MSRVRSDIQEGSGNTWKTAMADFCMSMMTLFMVLWIVSITDIEQRESLSTYFSGSSREFGRGYPVMDPGVRGFDNEVSGAGAPSPIDLPEVTEIVNDEPLPEDNLSSNPYLSEILKMKQFQGNLRMEVMAEGLLLQLVETDDQPMFRLGEYLLTPFFEDMLFELGPLLIQSEHDIAIVGHTDSIPYSGESHKNNWTLSYDRANNVREVLDYLGMAETRFTSISGMGASQPMDEDFPRAAINRRVDLIVMHRYE